MGSVAEDVDAMLAKRARIDAVADALTGVPGYTCSNYRGYVVTRPRGWVIDRHALVNATKGEIRNAR